VGQAYAKQLERFERKRAQMRKYRAAGWTLQRIANHFRITRQRVSQILK